MEPFTWLVAAKLLFQYGPQAVIFGQKIYENIAAGRQNAVVTSEDIAELTRLSSLTGEDIYKSLGIAPPPAPVVPPVNP